MFDDSLPDAIFNVSGIKCIEKTTEIGVVGIVCRQEGKIWKWISRKVGE